jgi:D-xylonolactonase
MSTVEKLVEVDAVVGEGPMWDTDNQKLLWTDIATGRMFSFDPIQNAHTQIHSGPQVGGFVLNKQGGLLTFLHDGVALWKSDDEWVKIYDDDYEGILLRFNDVIADPEGRVFAGTFYEDTMAEKGGKLLRFDPDGTVEIVEEGIGCSNGMGFSLDLKTMYYTDSTTRTIYAYEYDRGTGRIGNRRNVVVLPDSEGVPDGMTVDAEGFIWSAVWFGGCVIRFDPDGREERRLSIPAKQTSSVMFGGKDLTDLYVTTAAIPLDPGGPLDPVGYDWEDYRKSYRGGGLFRVRLDIQGREEFKANVAWPEK